MSIIPERIADCHPELYRAIMDRGRVFPWKRTDLPPGEPSNCFVNAQTVTSVTGTAYVEGFYMLTDSLGECWRHHGWNVDLDGYAIDITHPDPGAVYAGVTFTREEVLPRTHEYTGPLFPPSAVRSYIRGTDPRLARFGAPAYRAGLMTPVIDPDKHEAGHE